MLLVQARMPSAFWPPGHTADSHLVDYEPLYISPTQLRNQPVEVVGSHTDSRELCIEDLSILKAPSATTMKKKRLQVPMEFCKTGLITITPILHFISKR